MAKEFIVALEIGSTKITGIAGKKNLDGSISILAVAKEDSKACIRKGVVYNIDKTVQCLTNIINKLKNTLKTEIKYAYVGVGGQSILGVKNTILKIMQQEDVVTQDMVDELMDANRNMTYNEQEILDAVTQEYKIDKQYQTEPVGVLCNRIEGNYLNILWKKTYYKTLKKCITDAGIHIADMFIAPLALADSILTENEKRSGCALVDIGAETTTLSVYNKNILRHLCVIPIGANNITKDIASLEIDEEDAEKIKLQYGSAYTKSEEINPNTKYEVNHDTQIDSVKLINIIEARVEEIIRNIEFQIPEQYQGKLSGGFILTGGGANLRDIDTAFKNIMNINKVRIAKTINTNIHTNIPDINANNAMMCTTLALMEKGNLNCAGAEFKDELFPEKHNDNTSENENKTTNTINNKTTENNMGKGVVMVNDDEDENLNNHKNKANENEEEDNKPKNGVYSKFLSGLRNFGKKIIEEE